MISSLSRSADFERLSRDGRRIRSGPMTLIALPDPTLEQARVAFAIRRSVGTAVRRNRIRRRVREVCRQVDRRGELPAGLYLIAPQASLGDLDPPSLATCVSEAFRQASSR